MDNNETTRRLRWALGLDDREAARLMTLGGLEAGPDRAAAWRRRDADADFEPCPDSAVAALLDGLVRDRRGPPPGGAGDAPAPARLAVRMDNNAVLKALRIALQLRGEDIAEIVREGGEARTRAAAEAGLEAGDSNAAESVPDGPEPMLSPSEIGSLLRKPGSRNYRRCGDQVLRRFLAGLGGRLRDDATGPTARVDATTAAQTEPGR